MSHPFHPMPAIVLLVLCAVTYFAIFLGYGTQLIAMIVLLHPGLAVVPLLALPLRAARRPVHHAVAAGRPATDRSWSSNFQTAPSGSSERVPLPARSYSSLRVSGFLHQGDLVIRIHLENILSSISRHHYRARAGVTPDDGLRTASRTGSKEQSSVSVQNILAHAAERIDVADDYALFIVFEQL